MEFGVEVCSGISEMEGVLSAGSRGPDVCIEYVESMLERLPSVPLRRHVAVYRRAPCATAGESTVSGMLARRSSGISIA